MLENLFVSESNHDREKYAETILTSVSGRLERTKPSSDEWILAYYPIINKSFNPSSSPPLHYTGISGEYELLLRIFGIAASRERITSSLDRLRLIISRDPVLRNVVSPEEILRAFEKYGVDSILSYDVGMIILARMGFESVTSVSILESVLSADEDMIHVSSGALSDEFAATLNLYTRRRYNDFTFPPGTETLAQREMFLYACQISLIMTLFTGEIVYCSELREPLKGSKPSFFTSFPRLWRRMTSEARTRANIQTALYHDLLALERE